MISFSIKKLTLHLEKMFKIAFSKYNTWQMRQSTVS
jgi:hypothetical protein